MQYRDDEIHDLQRMPGTRRASHTPARIDTTVHTPDKPFCYDPKCTCHSNQEARERVYFRQDTLKRGSVMTQTLWGSTTVPKRRRRQRRINNRTTATPFSITGSNDCQIIGHTEGHRDLAGCTVCLDCGVKICCPGCLPEHPQDRNAIPIYCPRHEESEVKHAV